MPGFIGGSSSGSSGTGGEITFPKEFIDPVTKLRVSQPSNLIDTDFEYGLQPTKWETVELINNTPSFFSKSGDTTIPDIVSITTNAGTREIIVTTAAEHGLAVGIPINVTGSKSVTADGAYIINSIPNTSSFTYLCKDIQPTTASIEDLYSSIITGEFFQGSQIRIADSEGITTDAGAVSILTVRTPSPHGFGVNTPFYLLNLNSTVSQEFASANTETKSFDASNSATAQTFDGSNTLSTINIDWSNSAVSGGVTSAVSTSNATADTITVNHGTENFANKPLGTPLYYNVVSSSGFFAQNPRGVVFLKTIDQLGTSSSTFQVSEVPDGNAIDIVASITGTFQLANQARTFAGNNINPLTQEEVTVIYDAAQTIDATNTAGQVLTQTGYSGGGLVTAADLVGETGLPWYTGTMVLYQTDGAVATGLTNNTTYFVDSTFQQGTSNVYSFTLRTLPGPTGTAVSSISGGSGTQTFTKIGISVDRNVFHIQNHGYVEKDMLRYEYPEAARFTVASIDEEKDFYFVSEVYDSHNFSLNQSAGDLVPSTIDLTNIDRGSTITTTVTPIGLTAPITYSVTSGTLPSGLTLNTSTGVVSGTVVEVIAAPGREVVITAVDDDGTEAVQTHTYQINATAASITPATIDRTNLEAGTAMAATTATTTNLIAPITWAVSSGTLPTGLSLNTSTGVVSGTPSEVIASPGRQVTIRATDVGSLQAFQVHTYQVAAPPVVAGQANFTTAGTFTWTAPYNMTVSVLAVGAGGGGGGGIGDSGTGSSSGGGGGLTWGNDITVTTGQQFTVIVGSGGTAGSSNGSSGGSGGASFFRNSGGTNLVYANGGGGGVGETNNSTGGGGGGGGAGFGSNAGGGGNGGTGGGAPNNSGASGGGGAAGYAGNGGTGGFSASGASGNGGGGGGGGAASALGQGGGGVGLYGQGANGGGSNGGGGGGSGGASGGTNGGGAFGGGGGAPEDDTRAAGGPGGSGAIRIVWPSQAVAGIAARRWPSTNVNTDL